MDQDDIKQQRFNAFVAKRVGSTQRQIVEATAGLRPMRGSVPVSRKFFEQLREEFEARQ